jgi:hypothetical protein
MEKRNLLKQQISLRLAVKLGLGAAGTAPRGTEATTTPMASSRAEQRPTAGVAAPRTEARALLQKLPAALPPDAGWWPWVAGALGLAWSTTLGLWTRWPANPPPRLEALASRLGQPASVVLGRLDRHLYAASNEPWDGVNAWRALSPICAPPRPELNLPRRRYPFCIRETHSGGSAADGLGVTTALAMCFAPSKPAPPRRSSWGCANTGAAHSRQRARYPLPWSASSVACEIQHLSSGSGSPPTV